MHTVQVSHDFGICVILRWLLAWLLAERGPGPDSFYSTCTHQDFVSVIH